MTTATTKKSELKINEIKLCDYILIKIEYL